MKKQIGIISDTHDLLRPEVVSALQGCDAIFHCGDICREDILDELARIAPIWAVRGNNDFGWAERLKTTLKFDELQSSVKATMTVLSGNPDDVNVRPSEPEELILNSETIVHAKPFSLTVLSFPLN